MSLLWRKIKRSNKKAAKFRYSISCKEVLIECAHKWRPETIVVAMMHRKRRYEINQRKLDYSFDNPNQAMVLWPESIREPLYLTTTLFRDQEQDQFEDKEWTLIIEEITAKGKHKPLAAVSINLRLFITDIPGSRMEAKFKLRPLRKEVNFCTVKFDISSKLLRESDIVDNDRLSIASAGISIPEERPSIILQDGLDSKQIESLPIETEKFAKDVQRISEEIEHFNHKTRVEPPVAVADANQSISSVSTMPKFTYDETKMLNEIQQFPSPSKKQDSTETDYVHSKTSTTPRSSLPGDESPKLSRKRYTSGQKADEPPPIDLTSADQVKSLVDDIKALHSTKPPSKIEDHEANERAERIRQQARKMLQNPEVFVGDSKVVDEESKKRLHEEYRKLKAHTNSPAPQATTQVTNDLPPIQPLRRTASARSNSNTDLRKLEVITTQTNFRQFKKFEPSPQFQRKNYENPILPAYGRVSNGATTEKSSLSPSTFSGVFDRMKRYGSLRGQELADSLNQFVSPGSEFVDKKQYITAKNPNSQNSQHSTPTRKLPSQLEKDLRNSTDPSIELQKINDRIEEIERLGVEVMQKMQVAEHGSSDEKELLITRVELTNEKDALVRRQDYFNVLADLNETKEKVSLIKQQIESNGEFAKTYADKQKADDLMSSLGELLNREIELTQELDNKLEEEEQHKESSRQTLERTRNFNRAQQEPLSASKRFINNIFG